MSALEFSKRMEGLTTCEGPGCIKKSRRKRADPPQGPGDESVFPAAPFEDNVGVDGDSLWSGSRPDPVRSVDSGVVDPSPSLAPATAAPPANPYEYEVWAA